MSGIPNESTVPSESTPTSIRFFGLAPGEEPRCEVQYADGSVRVFSSSDRGAELYFGQLFRPGNA